MHKTQNREYTKIHIREYRKNVEYIQNIDSRIYTKCRKQIVQTKHRTENLDKTHKNRERKTFKSCQCVFDCKGRETLFK